MSSTIEAVAAIWGRWGEVCASAIEHERDRWFLWLPVLYGIGIAIYLSWPFEPPLLAAIAPALAGVTLAMVWRQGVLAVPVGAVLAAVAFGFAGAKLRTEWVRAPMLTGKISNVDVQGFVERVEPRPTRGPRVTVRVVSLGRFEAGHRPLRVRVRFLKAVASLKPGDAIRFKASLSPPAIPSLPGDFDFARVAFYLGIGGVGFAAGPPQPVTEIGALPTDLAIRAWIERRRQEIGARITAAVAGETGALANALMTGERGGVSQDTITAYRDAGILHILAISGLHMAIMAGSVFYFLRLLLAAVPSLALNYPIKKWAAGAAAVAAFAYLLISGASFATIRAFVMILIMLLAIMLDRPAIALRNVALAAVAILVVIPESLINVGFQMSFAAVTALVATYEAWRDRRRSLPRQGARGGRSMSGSFSFFVFSIIISTVVAGLAVAPFAAYHFHQSQQLSVLANLIAIPVCNFIVMPAALAAFVAMPVGLEALPLWLMATGIDVMTWTARRVAALPGAVGHLPAFSTTAFAAMVLGGLWLAIWRTRRRWIGLLAIAAGIGIAPFGDRPDVLVGRDGRLIAVRGADGRLAAMLSRRGGGAFELRRWLQFDGDKRSARAAVNRRAYRCDSAGCTVTVKGVLIAVARYPKALADDCRRAGVLVMSFPKPIGCVTSAASIDLYAMRDRGTHALRIGDGGRVEIRT
ncbi:MAG: ComEC/Rec2 family competence protein, partial [Hyphomicrobiaceae bacterium]|nr:ComEC/Rec2 family competence protein [Hyphomicrobiaceae bacterium]